MSEFTNLKRSEAHKGDWREGQRHSQAEMEGEFDKLNFITLPCELIAAMPATATVAPFSTNKVGTWIGTRLAGIGRYSA
jgi:hypothetical protein